MAGIPPPALGLLTARGLARQRLAKPRRAQELGLDTRFPELRSEPRVGDQRRQEGAVGRRGCDTDAAETNEPVEARLLGILPDHQLAVRGERAQAGPLRVDRAD